MFGRRSDFAEVALALACVLFVVVGGLFLVISFFEAIARVLRRVTPENRRMEPAQVWLNLVPVFNLVWLPVTVDRVADSLRNEFISRGLDGPVEKYGRTAGFTVLTLLATGVFFYPAFLTYPLAFIFGIVYWIQLNRYAGRLKAGEYRPPPADEGW